jgi:hypothetical protein
VSDRLFIRHPDRPDRNGYVTRAAFDALWSKKGYVIESAAPEKATTDDLNAELDRRAGVDPAQAQAEAPPPPTDPDEEKAQLVARLEAGGVVVDKRWGLKRLRVEAAALEDLD